MLEITAWARWAIAIPSPVATYKDIPKIELKNGLIYKINKLNHFNRLPKERKIWRIRRNATSVFHYPIMHILSSRARYSQTYNKIKCGYNTLKIRKEDILSQLLWPITIWWEIFWKPSTGNQHLQKWRYKCRKNYS